MNNSSKTIGVRFTPDVYRHISSKGYRTGLTDTEVVRNAVTESLMKPSLEHLLNQLEIRMTRKLFEMNCIIVGLNDEQRVQALTDCKVRIGLEVSE
ncbi:hypothetical protein FORC36_0142 [Vibrio vulnificus]|uniref:hypothetical protein n=1 Tax=Vibrio vulnificus TaxID=672 RepID=UPI000A204884|nr:hypothetical protein [Vibrio vulnificus]ARN64659.1 hypothetical protein FORC36_0142 [Vibrio vulnificus]